MFTFIIPLKSRSMSQSWDKVCLLLERTLRSIGNQTCDDYNVFVVCHDKPALGFQSPRVNYIEVDFDFIAEDKEFLICDQDIVIKHVDKGRKLFRGIAEALTAGATHVMPFDADDLVSNRVVDFVRRHPDSYGWYMNKGYNYTEGSGHIYLKRRNFYMECGSTFIYRSDALDFPQEPQYDRDYDYYRFFINHQYIVEKMRKRGKPLQPFPFRGVMYTINGENFFRSKIQTLPSRLKILLNNRKLTDQIKKEFFVF